MAHKTFISYKYSEAQDVRDRIVNALGDDATYYKGETNESPDLTDTTPENIKKYLADKMYDTSVTIVVISPNMAESEWIGWEIAYSLKKTTRNDRTSQRNGVVGVIKNINGYDWFERSVTHSDGHKAFRYEEERVPEIMRNNRFNQNPKKYSCKQCRTVGALTGSYISYVREADFLSDPNRYIDNAYEKSENDAEGYDITINKKYTEVL